MAILCRLNAAYGPELIQEIRAALPAEEIRLWPDETGRAEEIEIAAVNRMEPGFLTAFPNLKLVSGTGAGVDHFVSDVDFPRHVPLVRIVDQEFAARMADYVVGWTLFHHRDFAFYLQAQAERRWEFLHMRSAHEVRVGVMGLGQMGAACATRLAGNGYKVFGWSRSPRSVPGVQTFAGAEALPEFLAQSEILVNLLPLTDETQGILNRKTFETMPRGGVLINVGRGEHMVAEDVRAAVLDGTLRAATLDVFAPEPLAADDPLWTTPGIYITPHASSTAQRSAIVEGFAENVRRYRAGEALLNQVDLDRGY